jgi:hypothetical protein
MMKVVIVCDGGLVQEVLSDGPVEYCVIDYDVEGTDEGWLSKIPQSEGKTADAYAYSGLASRRSYRVKEIFKAVQP